MQKTRSTKKILLVAIASAALLFAGCAKKVEVASGNHAGNNGSSSSMSSQAQVNSVNQSGGDAQKPSSNAVYFAFDDSNLDAAARSTLAGYAAWLNANQSSNITIEGNCDERGSREYNLALGQRRADSIRDFISAQGVNSSRIDTVSFGEERPACRGNGEACWAQNRRGDIVTR